MPALASFQDLELRILHWVTCDLGTPFVENLVFWTHDPYFAAFFVPLLFLLVAATKRGRARMPGVLVTLVLTLLITHGVREVLWKTVPRERPGWSFSAAQTLEGGIAIATCERAPTLWVKRAYLPHSAAMPSSHSVFVGGLAIAITLGSPWVGGLAWAFAGCVGFGRLFYGKHWPTDVLAGFALAIVVGLLVHRYATPRVLALLRRRRQPPGEPPDAAGLPR